MATVADAAPEASHPPEAVAAAKQELVKRKITSQQIDGALAEIEETKQQKEAVANEPLEGWKKAKAFLMPNPIGLFFNTAHYHVDGLHRKADDERKYTFYGLAFYAGLIAFIILLDELLK